MFFPGDLESPDSRYQCGAQLLRSKSAGSQFSVEDMMAVLRDEKSGICRPGGAFPTAGSQVSLLGGAKNGFSRSCHWFTATPSPGCAAFKPFMFDTSGNAQLTSATRCQASGRQPQLWAAHACAQSSFTRHSAQLLAALESKYVQLAFQQRALSHRLDRDLFSEAVTEELALYDSQ
jgi:hypothetical protein